MTLDHSQRPAFWGSAACVWALVAVLVSSNAIWCLREIARPTVSGYRASRSETLDGRESRPVSDATARRDDGPRTAPPQRASRPAGARGSPGPGVGPSGMERSTHAISERGAAELRISRESLRLADGLRQVGSPSLRAGSAREIAALLASADDVDVETGLAALSRASGCVPNPEEFRTAVVACLGHSSAAVRAAALAALRATVADTRDVRGILALASDPSPEVRRGVADALRFSTAGDLSSPPVAAVVDALLSDDNRDVRLWTVRALRCNRLPDPLIERILSVAIDSTLREAALGGPFMCLREKPAAVVDATLEWLQGPDLRLHALAVLALSEGLPDNRRRAVADVFLRLAALRSSGPYPVVSISFVAEYGDLSHLEGLEQLAERTDLPEPVRARARDAANSIRTRAR